MTEQQDLMKPRGVEGAIRLLRGEKVILDADLADLYGVATRVLVQAVKRKPGAFSGGFPVSVDERRACRLEITSCDLRQVGY